MVSPYLYLTMNEVSHVTHLYLCTVLFDNGVHVHGYHWFFFSTPLCELNFVSLYMIQGAGLCASSMLGRNVSLILSLHTVLPTTPFSRSWESGVVVTSRDESWPPQRNLGYGTWVSCIFQE